MLVDKKTEDSVIVAIKMISGEEVIARKLSEDDHNVRITRPLSMVMAENPDNPQQTRVMFTPFMVAAGKDMMNIRRDHILAMVPARPDAAEQYETAISS